MNMPVAWHAPVIDLADYRNGKRRELVRKQEILAFKNKLVPMLPVVFKATELHLAADKLLFPEDLLISVRWELLQEVKRDRF